MAVYQQQHSTHGTCDDPLLISSIPQPKSSTTSRTLTDVPKTVVPLVQSKIPGNPKPEHSPHYPNFEIDSNDDELIASRLKDTVWLLARSVHRQSCEQVPATVSSQSVTDPQVRTQHIPVWSAYNSIVCEATIDGSNAVDNVHTLPLINAPAHEWPSLTTSLEQLHNLNGTICSGPVLVWLDMDLYKRARKIPYLDPQFSEMTIESPGQFHTVLCGLRCLGATLESSGLDQAWVDADLYSSVTVVQILNEKHHNRAIDANQITLQVLFDLWIGVFFEHHPTLRQAIYVALHELTDVFKDGGDANSVQQKLLTLTQSLDLTKHMDDFDRANDKYPMYKLARMYMKQVMNLLQFLRGT